MKKTLSRNLQGAFTSASSTTTYTSLWQPINSFEKYMIQVVWTGTPTANVSLVVSADPIPSLETFATAAAVAPTNYDTVSGSVTAATSVTISPSGSYIITYEVVASSANWVAVRWVNASSTATISAINFVGKGSLV